MMKFLAQVAVLVALQLIIEKGKSKLSKTRGTQGS